MTETSPLSAVNFFNWRKATLWGVACVLAGLALGMTLHILRPAQAAVDPLVLAWSSSQTHNSRAVAWGDVDNDGDLDLAVGNSSTPSRLYLNHDGALDLNPVWSSSIVTNVASLAWGDMDGDGNLDLVAGLDCNPCNAIEIYRNISGTLSASPTYSSTQISGAVRSVVLGDMDGDTDLDLAAGRYFAATLIFTNTGLSLGATPAITLNASGGNTTALAWGDYNNDGDLDLAEGKYNGSLRIYPNTGASLTAAPIYTSATTLFAFGLAWGDVDHNGYLDVATTGAGANGTVVFTNSVVGLTANPVFSSTEAGAQSVAWADFDNDGNLDLAASTTLYRNTGSALSATAYWVSPVPENPNSVAWGDMDNDGDPDLAAVSAGAPARVYRNDGMTLDPSAFWTAANAVNNRDLAWGDVDGDGDLDLATGNFSAPFNLYRNTGGALATTPFYTSSAFSLDRVSEIAWGDMNGDGRLDLAVGYGFSPGQERVYLNTGTTLNITPDWTSGDSDITESVAWGDVDNDGDLDLMTGNNNAPNKLYLNTGSTLAALPAYSSTEADYTNSVAWGDVDNDGDLDLAVGNGCSGFSTNCQPNRLYRNDGGVLSASGVWTSTETDWTQTVAWGDVDGDGDLDLAAGNNGEPTRLYRNDNGVLTSSAVWSSIEAVSILDLAWGDMDGDGDLDLVAGGAGTSARVYRNDNGALNPLAVWSSGVAEAVSLAVGDMDGDGDLDLATGRSSNNVIYRNLRDGRTGPAPIPAVSVLRPTPPFNADYYSAPRFQSAAVIPITYTLSDPNSAPVRLIRAFYSPDGGGEWFPAVAASGTLTSNLSTSPAGVTRTFNWDVSASGFLGQSDNVVFRIQAVPAISLRAQALAGPYFYGSYAAQTYPFRVRGTQVRVMTGTTPVSNAMVYRLPTGQFLQGAPIASASGQPFVTDNQGYLQGRGQIAVGDQLLALAPITATGTYSLYFTNGTPTSTGLTAAMVTQGGVQTLTVSSAHPLYLFNLDVALEWDASHDAQYLEQLQFNLQRASEYLYDFTDGQAALGNVNVLQNADDWGYAHVLVRATNRLRPYAIQGGIVITPTVDPQHNTLSDTITYDPGQVTMGSTWNRYGSPGQNLGDDWPIILAHELSHYLFYQDDTYLGLDANGHLIAVSSCKGSAMGDVYTDPSATEFIGDETYWQANCQQTLPEQTLGRNEWDTLRLWYPALAAPLALNANPGPSLMPFDFTSVQVFNPLTPTNALDDPTFYLNYAGGGVSTNEARAFLLRNDQYVIDLGSPIGGQNRVIARGAQPSDRLCVFDRPVAQFGCEMIALGDDQLAMKQVITWTPVVQISPVNSTTLNIQVTALPAGLALQARLFPEFGLVGNTITLTPVSGNYSGTLTLTTPSLTGHLQVWVNEAATETDPRRETIVPFSIGGNPGIARGGGGIARGGGGIARGGGGIARGGGGIARGGGAPLLSPDGQMTFFTANPIDFPVGEFYAIQGMGALPNLPPGRVVIGQGYSLLSTPGAPVLTGSISIQYLSNDVIVAGADETQLALYFYNGAQWVELDSLLDTYFNLATAPSQGTGIYALMASVQIPLKVAGWNLFAYPLLQSQPVTQALLSISGYYTTVYGYHAEDVADPWKVYDINAPAYVNDLLLLDYGQGYWINARQPITIHMSPAQPELAPPALPPSTIYGDITGDTTFTPAAGQTLTAWIGGVQCGQTATQLYNAQIVYAIDVFADGNDHTGCGAPGRAITFRYGARSLTPNAIWNNNQLQALTLKATQALYLPLIMR